MNEAEFQNKLADLMEEISALPAPQRRKLAALAEKTRKRHERLQKTVGDLQESLDYLRLSIKYLVFDLEATRRENQYLRNLIQQQDEEGEDRSEGEDDGFDGEDESDLTDGSNPV